MVQYHHTQSPDTAEAHVDAYLEARERHFKAPGTCGPDNGIVCRFEGQALTVEDLHTLVMIKHDWDRRRDEAKRTGKYIKGLFKEIGKRDAKIGQARAELARAHERLRVPRGDVAFKPSTPLMPIESFTDEHFNPSLIGES